MIRFVTLIAAAAAALAMAGCVTERVGPTPRGMVIRPAAGGAGDGSATPMTQPATGATSTSAALTVALKPLGSVPYDGQTLPVLSPTGGYLAVQSGVAPGWKAALGLEEPSAGSAIDVYAISGSALSRVPWQLTPTGEGLPPGTILGRGTTDEGVLVEIPEADGSRQIGLLEFKTGTVRRLTKGAFIHAQAVLLRDGTLLVCRRALTDERFGLVAISASGEATPITVPESQPLLPVLSPDQQYASVLLVSERGLDLLVLGRVEVIAGSAPWKVSTRHHLGSMTSTLAAFQAVASVEAMPPLAVSADATLASALMFVHPSQDRAAIVFGRTGRLALLPSGTLGAACITGVGEAGLVMSAQRAVTFAPWCAASGLAPDGQIGSRATISSGQYIARSMQGADGDVLLIGPATGASAGSRFQLVLARIVPKG